MDEKQIRLAEFNKAVLEEKATWWQMELPSGNVTFGDAKAKMLGYPESKFKNYKDFTDLLHPDDHGKAMKSMLDHLHGKKNVYEALYRIKASSGEYITFYDCGQIIKKQGENITVLGFVMKADGKKDILSQIKEFKEEICEGKPSIIDLVASMRG